MVETAYLLPLFNFIFGISILLDNWRGGLLLPRYKRGNRFNPDSYSVNTLSSVLGKLFSSVLNNRLESWTGKYISYMLKRKMISAWAVDSSFILHNVLNTVMEKGNTLHTGFIDFNKAFNNVVHYNILHKLLKNGIRGNMFNMLHYMYDDIMTRVLVWNLNHFTASWGYDRGECLSTFVFAMCISNREMYLSANRPGITASHMKTFLLLYVDDIVFFSIPQKSCSLKSTHHMLLMTDGNWKLILPNSMLLFLKRHNEYFGKWMYSND